MVATLEALMSLRERGLNTRDRVCNLHLPMIRRAWRRSARPMPASQVEIPPVPVAGADARVSARQGIPLTAYAPLAQGGRQVDPTLAFLGQSPRLLCRSDGGSPGSSIRRAS